MSRRIILSICILVAAANPALAAIPLITDDTGTQGKGNFQLELFAEYGQDRELTITTKRSDFSATLTYGISDTVDVIFGAPFEAWSRRDSDSESLVKGDGVGDLSLETKWKFLEKEGLSFALKPGITIPTGDADKGLGAGNVTYHLVLIATKEIKPWEFDMNVGYLYNANTVNERKSIWSASLDAQVEVVKNLKLVFDLGLSTNPDSSSNTPPAFILGGLIWSLRENLDIGLGVKGGLTKPEMDIAIRGGITWRF